MEPVQPVQAGREAGARGVEPGDRHAGRAGVVGDRDLARLVVADGDVGEDAVAEQVGELDAVLERRIAGRC